MYHIIGLTVKGDGNKFFRNRLLNLAVSLMRHRANRASTLYCQSEAKSHAGILGNVANCQFAIGG